MIKFNFYKIGFEHKFLYKDKLCAILFLIIITSTKSISKVNLFLVIFKFPITIIIKKNIKLIKVCKFWKNGRVVDANSLLNCQTRKGLEGSNPSSSAI